MKNMITYTSQTTLDKTHIEDGSVYLVDASAGDVTITLPELGNNFKDGTTFGFVKTDSSGNSVIVQTTGAILFHSMTDYTKIEADTPYLYHELAIINGAYKAIIGEWLPIV